MLDPLPHNARVLLVRLSALGDVLFALETLASLKNERPDIAVDFLVEDRFGSLLRGHTQIDRLLVFPRRHKARIPSFVLDLRRRRYDAVVDLHGILKSAWQVGVSRARRKLGYAPPGAREWADRFYRQKVFLPQPLPHRAERGYFLLRALGLQGRPARPVLPRPEPEPEFWAAGEERRVVIHPGASAFAAFKRWPLAHYADLARRLIDGGCTVAVSYGPGEGTLVEAVRERAPQVRPLAGDELGLVGLGAVLGRAHLVVAADTGPLHLAAAAGSRVLALFGPKDPALYGPRGEGHHLLFHDVPCRPCRRRSCVSPQCVLGLTVDRVENAVREALAP
jgi:ADP-heptose:LPS heptosyltransferase